MIAVREKKKAPRVSAVTLGSQGQAAALGRTSVMPRSITGGAAGWEANELSALVDPRLQGPRGTGRRLILNPPYCLLSMSGFRPVGDP